MDVLGVTAGAVVGMTATLAGVLLGVWYVRRLDMQTTMPTIMPSPIMADLEPDAPVRSPDLREMWPHSEKE